MEKMDGGQWYYMATKNLDIPISAIYYPAIDNVFPEWIGIDDEEGNITKERVTGSTATLEERLAALYYSDKDYRYTRADQYLDDISNKWVAIDGDGTEYYKIRVPMLRYSEQKELNIELEGIKVQLEGLFGRTFPEYEGDPMSLRQWNEIFTQVNSGL